MRILRLLLILIVVFMPASASSASISERLAGRILLQVEDNGEGWYVHPVDLRRRYLGRPGDAFAIMRELGLGISNRDLTALFGALPESSDVYVSEDRAMALRLAGRILLRVESKGEAYYINPQNLRGYYLGRPADAFRIMREQGLGITTSDLARITPVGNMPDATSAVRTETRPFWEYDINQPEKGWYWAREGAPPACPESLVMESPVEPDLATAILYPGQVRGDGPKDFKPHGGFTLKPNSAIELRAPMDGYLSSVARFTDEFGYHISLNFVHPCGIHFGGGHWGAVPPDIQAVIDTIPVKAYGDSRTEEIIPPYFVKKGQIIVTGLQEKAHPERPGFDWGVVDYRQPNAASKDPRFRELYGYAPWKTYYGVCWLDLLPDDQKTALKALPGGDGKQGKNSEYCK